MLDYAPNTPLAENSQFIQVWKQYRQFLAERGMKTVTERLLADSDAGEINRVALYKEWFHPEFTLEEFCRGKIDDSPAERILANFKPIDPAYFTENFRALGHLADIYNAWFYTYRGWCP